MEEGREYKDTVQKLFTFIEESPSQYHAVDTMRKHLEAAGYEQLLESGAWKLKSGGKYYVIRSGSSLIAFRIPAQDSQNYCGFQIVASHSDSPSFKIKTNPEMNVEEHYVKLNVEKYGGMLCAPWFDRPLSVAGRLIVKENNRLVTKLINVDRDLVMIPNLAIHMNRAINENGAPIDNQKHLLPILGTLNEYLNKDTTFMDLLSKEIGVDAKDILDYDLCMYNLDQPELVGFTEEFISAPRLDDITSVCALIHGLVESKNSDRVNLVCLFDNEEIGSLSKQGADSTLPSVIIGKIWQAFGKNQIDCMSDISDGLMLSVDVAHAYHPNYPGTQDITNYPIMNGGFILKTASNQSYTWDCESMASLIALCQQENIPYQRFAKHSNTKGGGTIGSIISSHLPMRTADIGVGLLAMHSSREMMGKDDQIGLTHFAKAFFEN